MKEALTSEERAILTTVGYYDLFSYPLTPFEIWSWLFAGEGTPQLTLDHTFELLEKSPILQARLAHTEGFWFVKGRQALVQLRKERHIVAERKYNLVLRAVRVFRFLPFIRMIAVCNSLAHGNAREESDLDLFIVTDPGKTWIVRQLTTGIAATFGWRPTTSTTKDKICLSFFVGSDMMDFSSLLQDQEDPYLYSWMDHLVPVWGDDTILGEFRSANPWHKRRMPNAHGVVPPLRRQTRDAWSARLSRSLLAGVHSGMSGTLLNRWYRSMQLERMPKRLAELANKDTRVVVREGMLKFHDNDRRKEFSQRFAAQTKQLTA